MKLVQCLCLLSCIFKEVVTATCDYDDCTNCVKRNCSWCANTKQCHLSSKTSFICDRNNTIEDESYECPFLPSQNIAYSDAFARTKALPIIAATNSLNPQLCLTNGLDRAILYRQLTVKCDQFRVNTCYGYTAVSDVNRAIIISFRGTSDLRQWMTEVAMTANHRVRHFPGGGKVNAYTYGAFDALWTAGMKKDLMNLKADKKHLGYDLWVMGHSLGGSMASLCAAMVVDLNIFPSEKVKLVTFGQPRTGDIQFAKIHEKLVPNSYRIVHAGDLIAHYPPKSPIQYHHRFEVWYNNKMHPGDEYMICDRPDDDSCSNSLANFSYDDHHHYFVDLHTYALAGCVHL